MIDDYLILERSGAYVAHAAFKPRNPESFIEAYNQLIILRDSLLHRSKVFRADEFFVTYMGFVVSHKTGA